jgi:hypothetical protein
LNAGLKNGRKHHLSNPSKHFAITSINIVVYFTEIEGFQLKRIYKPFVFIRKKKALEKQPTVLSFTLFQFLAAVAYLKKQMGTFKFLSQTIRLQELITKLKKVKEQRQRQVNQKLLPNFHLIGGVTVVRHPNPKSFRVTLFQAVTK